MEVRTGLKLDYLSETKALIREAIESKGQIIEDTDTFRSYAEKILEIKSEELSEVILYMEQPSFSPNSELGGIYTATLPQYVEEFELIEGQEYVVTWDDEYYCTFAVDASAVLPDTLYIGNGTVVGLSGHGEPFAVASTPDGIMFVSYDTESAHSVAIIKRVRPNSTNMMLQSITITENGEYLAEARYDGFRKVTVNVPDPEITLQDKTITENGTYTADSGFDGLGSVTVDVKGSSGSGGGKGSPFFKMLGITTTNSNKTNVDTTQSLNIPKGAKVIRAWKNSVYNLNKTYYSPISSVSPVALDSLEIDTSNSNYDKVSYTHKSGLGSYSSYNTFEFRVLISTDVITVTDAGDGLGVGTVNRNEDNFYGFSSSDRGVENVMYLKLLDLADGVTIVPNSVCYNQTFLESVDLTNAEAIGSSAFYGCESLDTISGDLSHLEIIKGSAFARCKSLKEFSIPANVTVLENFVFQFCESLESINLENITSIGSSTFAGCTSLKSISFSPNLTSIGGSAFQNCESLSGELIIPNGITELNYTVFEKTKFDRVVFPSGFTKMNSAFQNCTHPTEFDFSACTAVPSMISSSYLGIVGNGQILKIPSALFSTWSTKSGWKDWAAQMVSV